MDIAIQFTDETIVEYTDISTYRINFDTNCIELTKIVTGEIGTWKYNMWAYNLNTIRSYYIGKNIEDC